MNNSLSKNKNSRIVRNMEKEIEEVVNDAVEDIIYRDASVEKARISIVLEEEASKIFSDDSRWEILFKIGWSNYFIEKLNSGMTGLMLERVLNEEADDLKKVYGAFVKKVNSIFLKRKKILEIFSEKACEELCKIYDKKYNFVNFENVVFRYIYDIGKNVYVPSLKVRIKVKREK